MPVSLGHAVRLFAVERLQVSLKIGFQFSFHHLPAFLWQHAVAHPSGKFH
jgi:hypothetical protein